MKWPQQKLEMELKLNGMRVYPNTAITQRNPDIFRRESLRDLPSYDLARRALDGAHHLGMGPHHLRHLDVAVVGGDDERRARRQLRLACP